jgi:hypothetical protein
MSILASGAYGWGGSPKRSRAACFVTPSTAAICVHVVGNLYADKVTLPQNVVKVPPALEAR